MARHLPVAPHWKGVNVFAARQLERLVLHVLRLEHRVSHHLPPVPYPLHQRRSITWVKLIQSQWLLVASSDDLTSVISLWPVTSVLLPRTSAPVPLAEAFLPAPVVTGAVDVVGSSVVLALELAGRLETR